MNIRLAKPWNGALAFGAVSCLLATSPVAVAQDQNSPLRFLRPWLEQQLGVPEQPPAEEAAGEPEAAAPEQAAPGSGAASLDGSGPPGDAAVLPPSDSSAEPAAAPAEPLPSAAAPVSGGDPQATAPVEQPGAPGPGDNAGNAAPDPAAGSNMPTQAGVPAEQLPDAEPAAKRPQPLRIGVLAGRDVAATMRAVEPIAQTLTQSLARQVEILPLSSYGAMIDAQAQRRIDGGFYSAAAFALSEANCRCLEPLVAPAAADGSLAYHAIIVARAQSGIATVADLQGKIVAVGAEDSVGARRMQLAGLLAEGADPSRFGAVREVESGDDAVRLMTSGEADAAFAWSSMSGDVASGYSRGTLANLVARGELDMSQIEVVWRSPAITHGPFAVLETLDGAIKNQMEAYLVGLERAEPAAYDTLNPYYSGGYVAVEPADFAGLGVLAEQDVDELALPLARVTPETPAAAD